MLPKGLLTEFISSLPPNPAGEAPEVFVEGSHGYEKRCQIFNTKYQFRPAAIILVETAEQVSTIVQFANAHPTEINLSVRSGGHDHAGECSGTGTLLIDFSKIRHVKQLDESDEPLFAIGPGARFRDVKPKLDTKHLGIAHGTCETVAVAGFTMGGGWGPWTRRYGMGCERLWGATIVLGTGDIVHLDASAPADSREAKLLWALRGGGGLSYGIVTELRFKTFRLPDELWSFNLHCAVAWPGRKALEILQCWENAIRGNQNPALIGTNLKVVAIHRPEGQAPDPNVVLECIFNGYFAGTKGEAFKMIEQYFGPFPHEAVSFQLHRSPANLLDAASSPNRWHFGGWDRQAPKKRGVLKQNDGESESEIKIHEGISLDGDGPAPHKITSRLADSAGWDDASRIALLNALQSPLVPPRDETLEFPIDLYITLGAITGPYYATYDANKALPAAFPYKDRLFTIQFQAWWDQYLNSDGKPRKDCLTIRESILANRPWVNRAEDWIDTCRDVSIPGTGGAFISFKDSSVTTKTYFATSYDSLREVRETYTKDPNLLFRAGKTIP